MRYLILLLSVLAFHCCSLYSQNITVLSCTESSDDTTATQHPRYDNNSEPCAVIKVLSEGIDQITFKGNIVGEVNKVGNAYVVYVLNKTKRLQMFHADYVPTTIDLTTYESSANGVRGGKTYRLVVKGVASQTTVAKTYPKGSRMLAFSSEKRLTKLLVNGQPWEIGSSKLMPYGLYEYEAYTDGELCKRGVVELLSGFGKLNVKIDFNPQ